MNRPIPSPGCAPVAVLLVAGVGQRLRPLTNDRPKALVEVGGESILARATRLLLAHGVKELVLATGYCEEAVRKALESCPVPVRYCPNPDYTVTQNSVSLLACREAIGGRAFYKLDGDLLFGAQVLTRLDQAQAPLAAAIDGRAELGAEEMKVRLAEQSGHILEFGKALDPRACAGESIGIERIEPEFGAALFDELQRAYEHGERQLYYEDVYSRLLSRGALAKAVPVGDLTWMEVDTAQDLARAQALSQDGRFDESAA